MNISNLGRALRLAVIGAILYSSASCINIDETLGENFIPTDQTWSVFPCDAEEFVAEDIDMKQSSKLSGYSTTRFSFGSIKDNGFRYDKSTSFTLVPLLKNLDFGREENGFPIVRQFHLSAVRDTLSMVYDYQERVLQNVYAYALKAPLDSNVLYTGETDLMNLVADPSKPITIGVPVYDGGDSLSIDFSIEYAESVMQGCKEFNNLEESQQDSLKCYLEKVPGIVIGTTPQNEDGGRINMFEVAIRTESGYITGNYAELKITGLYNDSDEPVDTSFLFYFGPSDFLKDDDTSYPTQYAFNTNKNENDIDVNAKEKIYVEGGSGLKPVIKAKGIKRIVSEQLREQIENNKDIDTNTIVINKATIMMPFSKDLSYETVDRYPMVLSPTVLLSNSEDGNQNEATHYTYAGLTDSSIESENHGDINRSLWMYCPDISHHVQEIASLKKKEGETDADFEKRLAKYDIWMLIMHEEITETSTDSSYDDYYNNLLYNSYYNNMMYDPYGYGYGYGGYGYGYGGYGYDSYGYNNYYNYYMMAAYASASSSSSTTTSSVELDLDRFYNATLNGPDGNGDKPSLKITFSALKKSE